MQPSVHRQCPAIHKSLPTSRTLKGPLAGVPPSVNHQIATTGDVLPANFALIRPDSLVRSLDVGLEVFVVPIGPFANVTLERPFRLRRFRALAGRVTFAFLFRKCRRAAGGCGRYAKWKARIAAGVDDRFLYWQLGFGLLLIGRFGIGFL